MRDEDGPVGDALADEVMTYVDVLRASVELMILGKSDSGEIIGGDDGERISAKVEFSDEGAEPNSFLGSVGESDVLVLDGPEVIFTQVFRLCLIHQDRTLFRMGYRSSTKPFM